MSESAATMLYQDCPHCGGEGWVTVELDEDSPLLMYLGGATSVVKVCPHCVRRSVVPAEAAAIAPAVTQPGPRMRTARKATKSAN